MAYEQPASKSEKYGFFEEWSGLGEIVGESWLLPEFILGGFIEDAFGDFSND